MILNNEIAGLCYSDWKYRVTCIYYRMYPSWGIHAVKHQKSIT